MTKILLGAIAALATTISVAAAAGPWVMKGQLFAFHTPPENKCPGLDWYAYVDENNNVSGSVSWDRMQHMARFEGSLKTDGTFTLQAQEFGGPRTGTVSGKLWPTLLQLRIDHSGTGCDGVYWNIQRAPNQGAMSPG